MNKIIPILAIALLFCGYTLRHSDKLVGSIKSDKYHYETCRYVQKINPRYLIEFDTPEEAIKMGYVPCEVCKPPVKSKEE